MLGMNTCERIGHCHAADKIETFCFDSQSERLACNPARILQMWSDIRSLNDITGQEIISIYHN